MKPGFRLIVLCVSAAIFSLIMSFIVVGCGFGGGHGSGFLAGSTAPVPSSLPPPSPPGSPPPPPPGGVGGVNSVTVVTWVGEVFPLLKNRLSCRSCHAGAGQGRFRLTLVSRTDYDSVKANGLVYLANPPLSLLLMKPSGQVPHGGGVILQTTSLDYLTILQWIKDGAYYDLASVPPPGSPPPPPGPPAPPPPPPGAPPPPPPSGHHDDDDHGGDRD